MKTTVTEQEGNKVKLDVEVPADEVKQALDRAVASLAKSIRVDGFRRGKVPRSFIVQRLGMEAVAESMLEDELPKWLGAAVEEAALEPVDKPTVDFEDLPVEGNPFAFSAAIELVPVPTLGQYKGLEVPKGEVKIEDADVDAQVDRLRDQFAELRSISGRAVGSGDYVAIDFVGSVEGESLEGAASEDYVLEVGSGQVMPDIDEAVVGMSVGDEKTVQVDYPEDFPEEAFAGKKVDFRVTVKDLKEKVLPTLNDELAKDVSEFATLLELRLDIRKKLESSMQSAVDQRFRQAAIQKVVDGAEVEIPDVMVGRQTAAMFEDFVRSLRMRGADFEEYLKHTGTDVETLAKDMRPDALNAVKTSLVLDAVAEAEGVAVDDETIDKMIEAFASGTKESDPGTLRSRMEESGRIVELRQSLMRDKAVDVIVSSAVPVPLADSSEDASTERSIVEASAEAESAETGAPVETEQTIDTEKAGGTGSEE